MAELFADTTAIFEHQAGTSVSKASARAAMLDPGQVVTSDHVEREWKRIMFSAGAAIEEALRTEPDLATFFARLARAHGREASQRLRALAMCVGDRLDQAEIRIRVQQLLRADIDSRWNSVVGEIRRRSACGLATESPVIAESGAWTMKATCQRREGICRHEDRVSDGLREWQSGAAALKGSASDQLRSMGKLASEMASSPALRTGKNCYARTGDLSIALDCAPDETLITTDHSFDVIGPAMGVTINRIPSG